MKCLSDQCPVTSKALLPCLPVPRACAHPVGSARIPGVCLESRRVPREGNPCSQLGWVLLTLHPHRHITHAAELPTPRLAQTGIHRKAETSSIPCRSGSCFHTPETQGLCHFFFFFETFRHLISMISF